MLRGHGTGDMLWWWPWQCWGAIGLHDLKGVFSPGDSMIPALAHMCPWLRGSHGAHWELKPFRGALTLGQECPLEKKTLSQSRTIGRAG